MSRRITATSPTGSAASQHLIPAKSPRGWIGGFNLAKPTLQAQAIKDGRKRLKLTQDQLASKLGVSRGTVSGWECDRSSPGPSNQSGLEQIIGPFAHEGALGPGAANEGGGDIGNLEDFNPYDEDACPDAPGIYVFYDVSQRPVYVGESKQIKERIRQHLEKFWFKRPIVQSASYIEVRDEKPRRKLEQALIKFMKNNAVINKVGTPND